MLHARIYRDLYGSKYIKVFVRTHALLYNTIREKRDPAQQDIASILYPNDIDFSKLDCLNILNTNEVHRPGKKI